MFSIRFDPVQPQCVQECAEALHNTQDTNTQLEPHREREDEYDKTL